MHQILRSPISTRMRSIVITALGLTREADLVNLPSCNLYRLVHRLLAAALNWRMAHLTQRGRGEIRKDVKYLRYLIMYPLG